MALKFERLTANIGARVRGFDLSTTGDSDSEQALRGALRRYKLLTFHLPGFSAADQVRLASIFGEISTRRTSYGGSPSSETEYVSNTRADGTLGNGPFHYHHDHLFYEQPLSALMLYGLEIPGSGTATKFRDGHGFYESLPEETKAVVRRIDALHMLDFRTDEHGNTGRFVHSDATGPEPPSCWRPLVWSNPQTGKPQLLLSPAIEDFRGIERQAGYELLRSLLRIGRHEDDPQTTYVHHWKVGDLVIWDNVALAHARPPFDTSQPRTLRRTAIL